jgi:hypothetical protein
MHKNATKCNKTLSKWYKNKHGASKIMDTLETYHIAPASPASPAPQHHQHHSTSITSATAPA